MSTPVAPVAQAPAKLTAIQTIEQEIGNFLRQREQAIANVHAIDGAIQASQMLLGKLKAAAETAEAEVRKIVYEADNVIEFAKKEI